ncbi:MAG: TRAP transporter large permease [Halarsenatibacteraceae bacterium]
MDLAVIGIMFVILILGNIPIGFIFGVVGLYALRMAGFESVVAVRQIYSGIDSFNLLALPFFIFAGEIMSRGGIIQKLLDISDALVGKLRGSLGHTNVVASMLFAGISGTAQSDAGALGSMLIPAMQERGYSRGYSSAITAASSMCGPIIPPSSPLIIYGGIMDISIAGLFAAGMLPGITLGIILMVINYFIVVKRGYEPIEKFQRTEKVTLKVISIGIFKYFKNFFVSLKKGFTAVILFLIIFGGILGGIFTATEAAGIAATYAIILVLFVLRTINYRELWDVFKSVNSMIGITLVIVGTGRILSHYLAIQRVPQMIAEYLLQVTTTDWVFLLICAVFLLFVGTFMDLAASIIILGPVLTPVASQFGIQPFHFGIFFIFTLNVALITPPVGVILFVVSAVGKIEIEELVREIVPFYVAFIAVILLIAFFEPITTFMPKLLGFL